MHIGDQKTQITFMDKNIDLINTESGSLKTKKISPCTNHLFLLIAFSLVFILRYLGSVWPT